MVKADLHVHTTASDGLLTPSDVVKWANKKEIKVISITDHDTVSGIEEAIKSSGDYSITIVPGIELSCIYNEEEVHILGLFIDYNSYLFKELSDKLIESRYGRAKKIISKLNELDIHITLEEVLKLCNNKVIGRPHIARVLIEKGYVSSIDDAFETLLGNGKPAFISRYKLSINEATDIIHKTGGLSILAHPGLIRNCNIENILKNYNIDGIEVYHSKHCEDDIVKFIDLSREFNLIITGGSDWHGDFNNGECNLGEFFIDYNTIIDKRRKYD